MRKGIKKVGGFQKFGAEWRMSQYNRWWGQGVQGNKFALLDTMWVDICHHKSAPTYEVLTPRITFSLLLVNIPLSFASTSFLSSHPTTLSSAENFQISFTSARSLPGKITQDPTDRNCTRSNYRVRVSIFIISTGFHLAVTFPFSRKMRCIHSLFFKVQ